MKRVIEVVEQEWDDGINHFIITKKIIVDDEGNFDEFAYQNTYNNMVEQLISEKYTLTNEIALIRQRDTKPEEFQAYYEYVEECKAAAKEMVDNGQ